MKNFLHWKDAAEQTANKLKVKYWTARLEDMFEGAASRGLGRYADVKVLRVNPDWPVNGSVTLETSDGFKYKLVLKKNQFMIFKV